MSALENIVTGEIAELENFFPPMATDLVDGLIGQYRAVKAKIESLHSSFHQNELSGVMTYFFSGNVGRHDRIPSLTDVFKLPGAIASLNSEYWSRALDMTDVYDAMPQKRRDEWNEQIREHKAPDFEEATVRATLEDLMTARSRFFAERVDGIFRSLSREHVTNCPEGFSKRMIMYALDSYGSYNSSQCGHLSDLRNVIGKFMGREPVSWGSSGAIVKAGLRNRGQWTTIDGGALRIRVYLKGTAHLEVHPEMAWRLNGVLASIYPNAIPTSFRTKPQKKLKDFVLMDHILPQAVRDSLTDMRQARRRIKPDWPERFEQVPNALEFDRYGGDRNLRSAAVAVLEAIGGSMQKGGYIQFDYDAREIIDEIVCSGRIPDHKSHQFYPTPEKLARIAVEMASEGATDSMNWLEPSAGTGSIADLIPENAFLQCYEINQLHCKILEAKGFKAAGPRAVKCLDFLKLASNYRGGGYDRIVMNPPYSEGRWKAHTEAAAALIAKHGVIVAILPTSAKENLTLTGNWKMEWSRNFYNEFSGTSISVVMLKATKI